MRSAMAVAIGVLLLAGGVVHAETLRPGMSMPEIRLSDQHDTEATIAANVRYVLVTRDMDAGNLVKEALATDGARMLDTARAVYVSDISRMPGIVTNLFALPAMRRRGYRILLDRDGKATADIPSEEAKVSVVELGEGKVVRIDYLPSVEGVRALLTAD